MKDLLVSKLWKSERSAFLKFFHAFLKFDLPKAHFLNFPQNSTPSLIGPFLIIGDCVYFNTQHILKHFFWTNLKWMFNEGFWVSLQIVRCFRPRTDIFFCFAYNFVFIICHLKFVKSHCQFQIVFLKNSIFVFTCAGDSTSAILRIDLFTYKLLFTCDI